MINATVVFLEENGTATAGIVAFGSVLAQVKSKMVLINSLNQVGQHSTKGVTLDTRALRREMEQLALRCGNATLGFARMTQNHTLAALVDFSETRLMRMKKEDVDDVCEGIHGAAVANAVGASEYGAGAAVMADLQAAIDLYRISSQNPRQAVITRSQAKFQLQRMIRLVIDDLLEGQLDRMVNTLKFTDGVFWHGYEQVREIIDLGTTKARVSGVVVANREGEPLGMVLVEVLKAGTEEVVGRVKTGVDGKYSVGRLVAGLYDLRWRLEGYVDVAELGAKVSNGRVLRRRVVMKAM